MWGAGGGPNPTWRLPASFMWAHCFIAACDMEFSEVSHIDSRREGSIHGLFFVGFPGPSARFGHVPGNIPFLPFSFKFLKIWQEQLTSAHFPPIENGVEFFM